MDALRSVVTRLETEGAALGHFNVSGLVLLKAVLAAAGQIGVPVLVGASLGCAAKLPSKDRLHATRSSVLTWIMLIPAAIAFSARAHRVVEHDDGSRPFATEPGLMSALDTQAKRFL